MAAFDFPATAGEATDGSFTYTAPTGDLYEWNGYSWVTPGSPASEDPNLRFVNITGDNMTGNLTLGTNEITLNVDGSAAITGNFNAGGNPNGGASVGSKVRSDGKIQVTGANGGDNIWEGYNEGVATAGSTIGSDGRATFAGGDISLAADGSATFAGDLSVTGNAAFTNSQIAFGPGGVAAFAGGNIELNSNGSGTFAASITCAGVNATGGGQVYIDRNLPASNTSGSLVIENDGGTAITLKNNGDALFTGNVSAVNVVATGDIQSTSQNGGPLAGFRNVLINGNYAISQRYAGYPFTATGIQTNPNPALLFGPDRWGTPQSREFQSRNERPGQGNAFVGSIQWRTGTQSNAVWSQVIELIGDSSAGPRNIFLLNCDTWTVSHWIFAADRNSFVCDIEYVNTGYSPSISGTIANIVDGDWQTVETVGDWIRVSASFSMTGVADAPAGALGVRVQFRNNGNIRAVSAQLEPGPVCTPYEQRPLGTELALCQRYYYKETGDIRIICARLDQNAGSGFGQYSFPQTMRAVPTFEALGNWTTGDGYGGLPKLSRTNTVQAVLQTTVGNLAANGILFLNNDGGTMSFDAEL